MEPIIEKINTPENQSFFFKHVEEKYFSAPWHFHPEVEIFLVIEGNGTRYVGDGIAHFNPGDLALIGTNTPHVWSSGDEYYQNDSEMTSKGICIQFEENFWGKKFSSLPELTMVEDLFFRSRRGIYFTHDTKTILRSKILQLPELLGMKRLNLLLDILEIMSVTKDYQYISSPNYSTIDIKQEDVARIEKVYQHVLKNYSSDVSLEEVSALVNLSPQSFCRYFKSRTNKVFSKFLNEVRIGHACRLLIENKLNVAQICYETGFNHLSNFNRQFKKIKQMTPSQFQEKFRESNIESQK